MTTPLLTTKLFIPPFHSNLVSRPRLIDKLHNGVNRKCTLISAPAGFGKTTLLSEWANSSVLPFAWVTLNEGDNDIGVFLSYIITSLNNIGLHVDDSTISLLKSIQTVTEETLLGPLINQIESIGKRLVLVLDDYHLITSEQIHTAINFLLDNQPQVLHLVISSRSDPPIRFARLRANGQLTEIRATHLKFSIEDSEKFLNNAHGLSLKRGEIETLLQQTEGWIAGLQLAAISMIGKEDPSSFIQEFSGSYDFIADYFADEVLNQQPEKVQEFLLKTSILNPLCGELCQKVTGIAESKQILLELKKNNLFLISLDDNQEWFRYHRLFADLLHQRLLVSYPHILSTLHLIASEWFEEKEIESKAIEHAISGKYFEQAIQLLEGIAETILARSEIRTFVNWVEQIPQELILDNVVLSIYYSWALLIRGRNLNKVAAIIENIQTDNQQNIYRSLVVKSNLAFFNREMQKASEYSSEALENLSKDDFFFRNIAAWNLSALAFIEGDYEKGEEALNEVIRTSQASGNTLIAVIALCRQGQALMLKGQLHKPKELFQQALDLATDKNNNLFPVACEALLGLGKVYWHWNDLDVAVEYIQRSIEISKMWREMITLEGNVLLSHVKQTQGFGDEAQSLIENAKIISLKTSEDEFDDAFVNLNQANLWLRQGDFQSASRWVIERGLDLIDFSHGESLGNRIIRCYEQVVHARYLVLENHAQKAIKILNLILPELEKTQNIEKVIEGEILMAIAKEQQGQSEQALSSLRTAIERSKIEGYIQPFTDEIPSLQNLLEKAAMDKNDNKFVQSILKSFHEKTNSSSPSTLIEPLSGRELEVLPLLATELTVPEIAGQMVIATSTVRSHIKRIYSKLGVHSRHEAVAKAKEIKLI